MRQNNPPGNPFSGTPPGSRSAGATVAPGAHPTATPGVAVAPTPKPILPKKIVCPVCATTFAPRRTSGRCPVCGEQVVPAEGASRALPVITPVTNWLFREGNWRLVAVGALIVYQLIIFIVLWIHLAQIHAL